jgi:asparagine synthase (glutamine-hydrolysing)
MCGLAGFVGQGTRQDLVRMTAALAHRGPDADGFHVDPRLQVYLGHRRLSIVDIASGDQPMWNEDGSVGVIFNGEIYNHLELRRELERLGHRFSTKGSDTEVLVHGWEEWGTELPLRLNGMFAFAILDAGQRRLFLARDRFGEKPLYYTESRDLFAFASELTALTEHPSVPRSVSPVGLQKLFGYGFIPAPRSILDRVSKLPGGHWLDYDIARCELRVKCYWEFRLEPDDSLGDAQEPRLVEECGALLAEAARRRLMSDVPLGIFLSGGLDSSLVLSSLAKHVPAADLTTLTIGFEERSFDESEYARAVASHVGSNHKERRLGLDVARNLIGSVLARLDEPLGDASVIPTYLLSSFARENVTVALTGDGGDELFAGYDPFAALRPAEIYARFMPRVGHEALRYLIGRLPVSQSNMSLEFKLKRTLMGAKVPSSMRLPVWMAPLSPDDFASAFDAPMRVDELYSEAIAAWERDPRLDTVDRSLEYFTRFYLQDDILAKVDRASMQCSLETRAVFLDNDLVEFCRRLPNRFKFRNGERKYLLKKLARQLLPTRIVDRRKKGFGMPLTKWLRTLPIDNSAPGLRTAYIAGAVREHLDGVADHRLFLFALMAFQRFSGRMRQTRLSKNSV